MPAIYIMFKLTIRIASTTTITDFAAKTDALLVEICETEKFEVFSHNSNKRLSFCLMVLLIRLDVVSRSSATEENIS